jgi:hypothetical protein
MPVLSGDVFSWSWPVSPPEPYGKRGIIRPDGKSFRHFTLMIMILKLSHKKLETQDTPTLISYPRFLTDSEAVPVIFNAFG